MTENTMRAARFHSYGPPENLVVETVPRPQPKEGEVLVRVHAVGVNPFDWKLRKGLMQAFMPLALPVTPGVDLTGVVEAVGPGVTGFQPGQAVFGGGSATYAEYAIAKAVDLAPKPASLTFDQAAALPTGARTAWLAIFGAGDLQPGQTLLVHGAAGGVGAYAVQFGRWKGAHVIGTVSAANVEFVRSLGAETVIDYGSTPFESVVRDVDVVLNTVGGDLEGRSWQVLRPGGIYVTIVGRPNEEAAKQHGVRAATPPRQAGGPVFQKIGELIESGDVVPVIHRVFRLAEVAQAHALSETGHGRGRIVLHVRD
jgi:NADPH:quinone reductase-like Zn-dependent oxidoreductase